ncbi:MAG: hypothetical protein KGN02_02055 [bacterium]|nr:hypothetical protein [bacterium]
MKRTIVAAAAALALATAVAPAATRTISGTLVNVASYVTGNADAVTYGMGSMMAGYGHMTGANGSMMSGTNGSMMGGSNGSMMGGSTGQGWMRACAGSVGLVTKQGKLYLLVTQAGTGTAYGGHGLCSRIGSSATVSGETFERGGIEVLEVESLQ